MAPIDTNRIARRAIEHKPGEPHTKGAETCPTKRADNLDGVQGFRPAWLKALDEKNVKGTCPAATGQDQPAQASGATVSEWLKHQPSKRV